MLLQLARTCRKENKTVGGGGEGGGGEESVRMFKTKYFQMYSVFSKKSSSLKFFPFFLD